MKNFAVPIATLKSLLKIRINLTKIYGLSLFFKRIFDMMLGSLLIILFFPLMVLIGCAIVLESRGSPIYRQRRKGYGGRSFLMYKFRTMNDGAHSLRAKMINQDTNEKIIFKFKDDGRITAFGRYLRVYSLDELPQLLNVIKGDMSLVGPRPFSLEVFERIPTIFPHLQRWMHNRHQMRPGMTGLWQVNGRNELPTDELIRLDLEYIDNWTIGLDIAILLRTIPVVLTRRGAY